jgi:DnaJ family protein C protein 8
VRLTLFLWLPLSLRPVLHRQDSRMLVLRALDLKKETPDTHPTLKRLTPPLADRIRAKAKELLIDEELRKRRVNKLQMIAEGADAQRKDSEANTKKRTREDKQAWEESRESRVHNWRDFKAGNTRKKAKVYKALG